MAATPPTTPPAIAPALLDFGTGVGKACWFEDSPPAMAVGVVGAVLAEEALDEGVGESVEAAAEAEAGFISVTL